MQTNNQNQKAGAGQNSAKRTHLTPGRDVTFAGFDGNTYDAVVLSRPRKGLIRIRYGVRGIGMVEPAVQINRVLSK
jgi:hypothetical protein